MTVNVKHSKPCKYFKSVSEDLQIFDASSGSSERPSEGELGLSWLSNKTVCSLCACAEIVLSVSDINFFVFFFLWNFRLLIKDKGTEHLVLRENKGVRESSDSTKGKLERW